MAWPTTDTPHSPTRQPGGERRGTGGVPSRCDASTFRVAAGVEWGALERARAQWRGHLGTPEPLLQD
ncbi:unnamed protein product [Lota lota]